MNLCFPPPACLTLLCCETEKKEKSSGGGGGERERGFVLIKPETRSQLSDHRWRCYYVAVVLLAAAAHFGFLPCRNKSHSFQPSSLY